MSERTRTREKLGELGTHEHVSNTVSTYSPVSSYVSEESQTMTDRVTPDFFRALREGLVVNNPCTYSKSVVTRAGNGTYYATRNSNPSLYSSISGSGSLTQFWSTRVRSVVWLPPVYQGETDAIIAAKAKALSNINKAPYSVNEDIAEIRQTVRFLKKPFSSLDKLSKEFARRKRGIRLAYARNKRRQSLESLYSSLWLECRFAFLPLTRSIVTVIDSLNRPKRNYARIQTARGTAEGKPYQSELLQNSFGTQYLRSVESNVHVRAIVQYRQSPPLDEWRAKYGFRVRDIPELAWDLFPLSFMYDRIFDVGAAIGGLTNFVDPSVTILSGTVSSKKISKQTASFIGATASGWSVNVSPDVISIGNETYVRGIWQPTIFDTIPPVLPGGLVKDLSSMVDLASLILQRLR